MIHLYKINTDITIKSLEDLIKLKPLLEDGTLKINKSEVARQLGKDRRTINKYINGYKKPTIRDRTSRIDDYYPLIKELLSNKNEQIFYYKRVGSMSILWTQKVEFFTRILMPHLLFVVESYN